MNAERADGGTDGWLMFRGAGNEDRDLRSGYSGIVGVVFMTGFLRSVVVVRGAIRRVGGVSRCW